MLRAEVILNWLNPRQWTGVAPDLVGPRVLLVHQFHQKVGHDMGSFDRLGKRRVIPERVR